MLQNGFDGAGEDDVIEFFIPQSLKKILSTGGSAAAATVAVAARPAGPSVFYQPLSAHPDSMLRRTAIIHQAATHGLFKSPIHYDPIYNSWVYTSNNKPLSKDSYNPMKDGVNRADTAPGGIVYVMGSMDFSTFKDIDREGKNAVIVLRFEQLGHLVAYRKAQEALKEPAEDEGPLQKPGTRKNRKADAGSVLPMSADEMRAWMRKESLHMRRAILTMDVPKRPTEQELLREDSDDAYTSNATSITFGDVETDSTYVTAAETLKYIRQYIMRSVTGAAVRSKSLVITSVTGDLSKTLAEGAAMTNPVGEAPSVRVVKVSALPSGDDEPLNPKFTDHIVVFEDEHYPQKISSPPSTIQVHNLCRALVREMSSGHFGKTAVERKGCPVVVTLFGGDVLTTKFELAFAVDRLWPIFVFDGSGGYADVLARCLKKAEECINEDARYKAFISTLDPITAEIVRNGKCLLVEKAGVVDTVMQAIECSLYGDDTLRSAWGRYALWHMNMEYYAHAYKSQLFWILFLGILATGLSIWQTFAQLTWPADVRTNSAESQTKAVYTFINCTVIFLPILMQLVQTISNRMDCGAKWVSLRWASESIAREIYLYRTRGLEYSNEAVSAAKKRRATKEEVRTEAKINLQEAVEAHHAGGADNEGIEIEAAEAEVDAENDIVPEDAYNTRQELLHIRLERITNELADTDFCDTTLQPYLGPLPPLHVQKYGDEGFTDLTPDDYVRFRLLPKQQDYLTHSRSAHVWRTNLQKGVHVFNTLGTVLAALATYDEVVVYNLQAWVSFTTALVGALTRFEHMLMLDWIQNKFNRSHLELSNVLSWWTSRGANADTSANRSELMRKSEDIMADEVVEFRKQLKTSIAASKTAAEDMQKLKEDALLASGGEVSAQEKAILAKIKDMNLDTLSFESLSGLLDNSSSAQAKKVIRVLQELNKDMGDVISTAKVKAARLKKDVKAVVSLVSDIDDVLGIIVDDTGTLRDTIKPKEIKKYFPNMVADVIKDPKKRACFLTSLQGATQPECPLNMGRKAILKHCKAVDSRFESQVKRMPYRMLLEVFRSIVLEEIISKFSSALDHMGLNEYDFIETREEWPTLLADLMCISALPWRYLDREFTVCFITNDLLRYKLSVISENKLRNVLKRSEQLLMLSSLNTIALDTLDERLADIDVVNLLLENDIHRIEMVSNVAMYHYEFALLHLSRDEILTQYFPAALHAHLEGVDDLLLKQYVERLQEGMPGTHLVEDWIKLQDTNSNLNKVLHSAARREMFLLATKPFNQMDILRLGKQALLKRLNNCPHVDDKMFSDMKLCSEVDLRGILCGVLCTHSNSYAGRIFDMLSDEMTSFDIFKMLDFEEQLLLMKRMNGFRGCDVATMTRGEILATIAYRRIADKLRLLHTYQIRDLIKRIMALMNNTLSVTIFTNAARRLGQWSVIRSWRVDAIDRMARAVVRLDSKMFSNPVTPTANALITRIADAECRKMLKRALHFNQESLWALFKDVHKYYGDQLMASMFEGISRNITDRSLYAVFDTVFATPAHRENMLYCISNILTADAKCLHIDTLRSLPNAELKNRMYQCKNPRHQEQLHTFVNLPIFKTSNFRDMVCLVMAEAVVSVGYTMTLKIADDVHSFALRGVTRGLHCRTLLAPLISKLIDTNRITFDRDTGRCLSNRADFFHDFDGLAEYTLVLNELAVLPEDMLRTLLEKFNKVINKTRVGKFFKTVNAACASVSTERFSNAGKWIFFTAIMTLRNHSKGYGAAAKVLADFDNYDARFFVSRMESERRKVFMIYLASDALATYLAKLTEADYSLLFSFLKAVPVTGGLGGSSSERMAEFAENIMSDKMLGGMDFHERPRDMSMNVDDDDNDIDQDDVQVFGKVPPPPET